MLTNVPVDLVDLWMTGLAVVVLLAIAAVVLSITAHQSWWQPVLAIVRGMLQLAILSVILSGVITNPVWVYTALTVMFIVAVITSSRRIGLDPPTVAIVATGIALAVAVVLIVVFSLGATPRIATIDIARTAIREALVPSMDQAKTTGLVTLPGAFVGAIFGGVSPLEAGRFQIVVLAGLMTAGAISESFVSLRLAPRLKRPVAER